MWAKRFLLESKAQISAEMIIVMAALLGIAVLIIKKLSSTGESFSRTMTGKADTLVKDINEMNW